MVTQSKSLSPPLRVYISYDQAEFEVNKAIERLLETYSEYEVISNDLIPEGPRRGSIEVKQDRREIADVFVLLVSDSYRFSRTVKSEEFPKILERVDSGQAFIIPYLVEQCEMAKYELASYQFIPKGGMGANEFKSPEEPMHQIIEKLKAAARLKQNVSAFDAIAAVKKDKSENLILTDCQLSEIPEELLNMPWIRRLSLEKNSIRKIENLNTIIGLEDLNLAKNQIVKIENLEQLTNLTVLDLEKNYIEKIENLNKNERLHSLGLSSNRIEAITGISHLKELRILYAGHNGLKEIGELKELPQLRTIVLSNNRITTLRPLIAHIANGLEVYLRFSKTPDEEGIFISNNSLISEPPIEEISLGRERIMTYFAEAEEFDTKKLEILKLILVGNSAVGKSNLSQFLRKVEVSWTHKSTHLLDIEKWNTPFKKSGKGSGIQVNIFDFGGQDYYHDSHGLYYSHDTAYILMWDTESNQYSKQDEDAAKNKKASKAVKTVKPATIYENYPLEYWLESIRYNLMRKESFSDQQNEQIRNTSIPQNLDSVSRPSIEVEEDRKKRRKEELIKTAPVLILQNKIDIKESLLDQKKLCEDYSNIKSFFNVALKAKKRTKVLHEVLGDYLTSLDMSGRELLTYQYKVVQHYLQNGERLFQLLTLPQFYEECVKIIDDPKVNFDYDGAHIIAKILNSIGVMLYSQPEKNIREKGIVFTRIGELNQLIKDIMLIARQGNDKGLFTIAQVKDILHKNEVIDLLIQNKSIIKIGDSSYLAPQFLPVEPDTATSLFLLAFTVCQVRYQYPAYFPKSLLLSLFAKFLTQPSDTDLVTKKLPYWRNGIILSKVVNERTEMVFVNFVKEPNVCQIEIRTMFQFGTGTLEREVEITLDELNEDWTNVKEVSVNSEDYFSVKRLKLDANNRNYSFAGTNARFSINDFKHLVKFEKLPKKLFISYSSKNSDFIKRFVTHLEVLRLAGFIEPWYDRMIEAGSKWDDTIKKEMTASDIIIFLLSPDFLATEYIMKTEVRMAMDLSKTTGCSLFFVEVQACSWEETSIWEYQQNLDPRNIGKKTLVINKADNDADWKEIVKLLKAIVV